MKHIHGIEIRLMDLDGTPIAEGQSHTNKLASVRFPGRVGSSNVSLPPGEAFKVLVKLHKDFKIYKAEGVKIVVVANATYSEEGYNEDDDAGLRQRYGLWWLDVGAMGGRSREVILEGFTSRKRGSTAKKAVETRFLAPEVDANAANATENWVTQDHYCANKGCIAVFVERGKLLKEAKPGKTSLRRSSETGLRPIRYEEFVSLGSTNGYEYVFEFRNVDEAVIGSVASLKNEQEFGREPRLVTSDNDIVFDTDCDITSEEEAVATDSSDSESSASEASEDTSPPFPSRKRKASTPQKSTSHKKQRTTAGQKQKQAQADATNATLPNRYLDSDRDDSEVELPCLKNEPDIKQERTGSPTCRTVPQASTASVWRSGYSAKKRRIEVIDLTMDDSADEDTSGGAVQALRKRLADMGQPRSGFGIGSLMQGKRIGAKI